MSEHDNDGEFASVVWDTPEAANQSAAARKNHSSSGAGEPSSSTSGEAVTTANTDQDYTSSHGIGTSSLQRAGSTASNNAAAAGIGGASHADAGGAGGSGSGSNTGRYWVKASVVEPVKMLEGTKDAYVAYNVKGEVGYSVRSHCCRRFREADAVQCAINLRPPTMFHHNVPLTAHECMAFYYLY